MKRKSIRDAFTLTELLVVMVVIAMLVALSQYLLGMPNNRY